MVNIVDIEKYFPYKIEPGVTIELEHFLRSNDLVKNFEIEITQDNKYIISIWLTQFNKITVGDVFFLLLRFINYTATFYTYEVNSESIKYHFLSRNIEGDLGFYFIITFYQEEKS